MSDTFFTRSGGSPPSGEILNPADLQLPDVPQSAREDIRAFLTPLIRNVHVKPRDCWRIAQDVMANAMRQGFAAVNYVEGVWVREESNLFINCENEDWRKPAAHAWITVCGHPVDLVAELYHRTSDGEDAPWLHEPHKVYTQSDVRLYLTDINDFDGFAITTVICCTGYASEFGLMFTEEDFRNAKSLPEDASWESHIFLPPARRMAAKHDYLIAEVG